MRIFTIKFSTVGIAELLEKPATFEGCSSPSSHHSTRARQQKNHSIFFIETSGEACLTARQACSVESAARQNPSLEVVVYAEANRIRDDGTLGKTAGQRRSCPVTHGVLSNYENIRTHRGDLLELLKGTPLWRLVEKNSLKRSKHQLIHRSDAVRVAVLWKSGGVYLDLDCVVLRPLHCLENTLGSIDFIADWVENGVMTFDAGHPFLKFLMKYMVFAFKPDEYMSLGPATVTDALKHFCERDDLPASRPLRCRNATLFVQPPEAFYAIGNRRQNAFYHDEADPDDWLVLRRTSFLTHVYDAGNADRSVPERSLYGQLAAEFCPLAYRLALEEGHF